VVVAFSNYVLAVPQIGALKKCCSMFVIFDGALGKRVKVVGQFECVFLAASILADTDQTAPDKSIYFHLD